MACEQARVDDDPRLGSAAVRIASRDSRHTTHMLRVFPSRAATRV